MTNASPILASRAAQALSAYQSVDDMPSTAAPGNPSGGDFSTMLKDTLEQAVEAGHTADAQATQAIGGKGDLTSVVAAVSRAQLALQTTVAIRDRVLQAYQDVIKMPI